MPQRWLRPTRWWKKGKDLERTGHQPSVKRWLAWMVVGLGFAAWACGRSSKNPEQDPDFAQGGCANDCSGSGGPPTGDAAGMPDAVAGTFSQGGSFSPQAGGTSSAGAAGSAGAPSSASDPTTLPGACEPSTTSCSGHSLYGCEPPGRFRTLLQRCDAGGHCEQLNGSVARCVSALCVPGETLCVGNEVRACSEGAFLEPGRDCGELVCEGNTCLPRLCLPGANVCVEGDVHACLGKGAKSELKKTCLFGSACGEVPGTVGCVVLACEPEASACVDNQIGACAHDGSALGSVEQDCAQQGKVCDTNSSCSSVAVDELGGNTLTEQFYGIFNAIDVRSARQLTKVELGIGPPERDTNVHWKVYRELYDGLSGFQEVLAEADSVLHAGETTASTTELSCALEAGKRYHVGAGFDESVLVNAAFDVVSEPEPLSFGLVNVANDVLVVFAMRITTKLP